MEKGFTAEILQDWDRILSLEREWNPLLRQSRSDIVFLTWEWMHAWYSVVGDSVAPFVLVVRDPAGTLAGLAPFYIAEYRLLHGLRYRVLRMMADDPTGAECIDWIVRADRETEVYRCIAAVLAGAGSRWDCLWMPYVAEWTGAADRLSAACSEQAFFCNSRQVEFGFLELPSDVETFLGGLSGNRRSELRRQRNALLKNGRTDIRRCRSDGELEPFLDALFDLHHQRWQVRGDEGTFRRRPAEALFYRRFLPVAQEKGWLRMYGLFFGGALKAVQLGYAYNGIYYQIQEGFDPEFTPGAGNVLRAAVIEDCISTKLSGYDFLGEMTEHKKRWAAASRFGCHLFIGNRKIKNAVLFHSGIWPTGRYLKPSGLPV